jgi:hypothetical protein
MMFFHGDSAAAATHELHRRQFILTHMLWFNTGCTTETALLLICAWIAQVSGRIRYRTAIFTCISHDFTPFQCTTPLQATGHQSEYLVSPQGRGNKDAGPAGPALVQPIEGGAL